jgi:hypothetical protein
MVMIFRWMMILRIFNPPPDIHGDDLQVITMSIYPKQIGSQFRVSR